MLPHNKSEFYFPLILCTVLYPLGAPVPRFTLSGLCFSIYDILRRVYSMDLTSLSISSCHRTTNSPRLPPSITPQMTNYPYFKSKMFYFAQYLYLSPLPTYWNTYINYGVLTSEFWPILPFKMDIKWCYLLAPPHWKKIIFHSREYCIIPVKGP